MATQDGHVSIMPYLDLRDINRNRFRVTIAAVVVVVVLAAEVADRKGCRR